VTQTIDRLSRPAARGTAAYEVLRPLMEAVQARAQTAERFYWEVTQAYHESEAPVYDRLHADLFRTLLPKWHRLVAPIRHLPSRSIRWLDVGCGTGLVGTYLSELLGARISVALMADPSPAMIELCRERAAQWPFDCAFVTGKVEEIPRDEGFDLITVNSVLHHVVDLGAFCRHLQRLIRSEGYLITCQDPRGEGLTDRTLMRRAYLVSVLHTVLDLRSAPRAAYRVAQRLPPPVSTLAGAARRVVRGRFRSFTFGDVAATYEVNPATTSAVVHRANRLLLDQGIIGRALSPREFWAVTDYHVPGQPGNLGSGISLHFLTAALRSMRLEEYFTYGFFGKNAPHSALRRWEDRLFWQGDPHGSRFASRWRIA